MHDRRGDARRACVAYRERAFASPAPVAAPLLGALGVVVSAVLVSSALGLSVVEIVAVVAAVAVAAVVVAHRTVGSVLAGVVLLLIRPYAPGERLRLHSPRHGGSVEAVIVRIGLVNTTLATDSGLLIVANNRLLKDVPQLPDAEPCR